MEPPRDDTDLAAELRALRPTPRPEFAAELDERAAAGFPRRTRAAGSPVPSRCAQLPARDGCLVPAGASRRAAIVVATAVTVAVAQHDVAEPTPAAARRKSRGRIGSARPPAQVDRGSAAPKTRPSVQPT